MRWIIVTCRWEDREGDADGTTRRLCLCLCFCLQGVCVCVGYAAEVALARGAAGSPPGDEQHAASASHHGRAGPTTRFQEPRAVPRWTYVPGR